MGIIVRMLRQTAVYWPPQSSDNSGEHFDNYGVPQVSAPIEIDCRWEDVVEEFVTSDGTQQLSNAKVYVDRDLSVGGILMLGEIADITDPTNIKDNDGAWEIRRFDKLPNFKASEFLRTAFL